jgi:hypothetical protein
MSDSKKEVVVEQMPGADPAEAAPEQPFDFNFGLGDEPAPPAAEASAPDPTPEPTPEPEKPAAEPTPEPVSEAAKPETPPEPTPEPPKAAKEPEQRRPMVPKARLDEVLAKQKALQKQLDDLMATRQAAETAPDAYDFASKEVEYQNLVLDGQHEKAAALRADIRKAERAQIEFEMGQKMEQKVAQSYQISALQQAAAALETNFPVFDRSSPDFNEKYTQEVIDLRDAFIVKGENAVAALSKAAKFVISEYGLAGETAAAAATTPVTTPTTGDKTAAVDEVTKKRAEVANKLKAAASQPPDMAGESSAARGEKTFDLMSLTEEEFNALPPATLKRLRGDLI